MRMCILLVHQGGPSATARVLPSHSPASLLGQGRKVGMQAAPLALALLCSST